MTTGPERDEAHEVEQADVPLRVLVFEDSVYRSCDGELTTDRAFLYFATQLVEQGLDLTMVGRLDPTPSRSYYRVPPSVRFVRLPYYPNLVHPSALPGLARSLRRSWSALGDVEVAWLMGPHPLACALAVLARLRGVPIVLGVRQDLPQYARERHPGRRWVHRVADLLEGVWRRAARHAGVVAVGPELSRHYAGSAQLLSLDVCMVPAGEVGQAAPRSYDGELRLLSVGRLEQEKNPLMLADVLALLRAQDPRWRLVVCGEGSLAGALKAHLVELGVDDYAELVGYVPVDQGLLDLYRDSHVFLHLSWTEGLPQVLFEAWSAALPVVATAVGGVTEAAGDAALLVQPGDAAAAVDAVLTVAGDPLLRRRLVDAGSQRLVGRTMDDGVKRLAGFLHEAASPARRRH